VTTLDDRPRIEDPNADGPLGRPLSRRNLWATITGGYLPLLLATAVVILPMAWMVVSSFKAPDQLVTQNIVLLPRTLAPRNYLEAARTVPFPRLFLNSAIVTVLGAGIKVILAVLTAYALVFIRFPAKRWIFGAILVTLMGPRRCPCSRTTCSSPVSAGRTPTGASSCPDWAPASAPSCCASTS